MKHVYVEFGGESVAVPMGESVIGRDTGCTFRFTDSSVSRRHARLIHRADEVFVEDLGSANGTLLNGRTITAPIRLHDGDVVSVGKKDLKVSFADPSDEDDALQTVTVRQPLKSVERPASQPAQPEPAIGRRTVEIAAAVPPRLTANERCPRCAAVIGAADEACGNCRYYWGGEGPGTTSLNRRRFERFSADLRIIYSSATRQLTTTTLDISANGVFVCTQNLDPVGTSCTLTFVGEPPLEVGGIVRRVVEPGKVHPELVGLGIELTDIGVDEGVRLEVLIEELAADR